MSEKYISLAEVRELLTEENEKREVEFNAVQKSAMAHAQTISKISPEQAQEIVDEVLQVGGFVTEAVAFKIADILPKYPEDVRAIFAKERVTLEADDTNKILDIVAKYL